MITLSSLQKMIFDKQFELYDQVSLLTIPSEAEIDFYLYLNESIDTSNISQNEIYARIKSYFRSLYAYKWIEYYDIF